MNDPQVTDSQTAVRLEPKGCQSEAIGPISVPRLAIKPAPMPDGWGQQEKIATSGFLQASPLPLNIPPRPAEVAGIPAATWAQLSAETRMAVLKDLKLL